MTQAQANTGTRNEQYNLVSVLYHCLEGSATYEQYIRDAQQAGDNDLANFFQEVKDTNSQLAERAKQLLGQRLS
jgi:phage shock protein A